MVNGWPRVRFWVFKDTVPIVRKQQKDSTLYKNRGERNQVYAHT